MGNAGFISSTLGFLNIAILYGTLKPDFEASKPGLTRPPGSSKSNSSGGRRLPVSGPLFRAWGLGFRV